MSSFCIMFFNSSVTKSIRGMNLIQMLPYRSLNGLMSMKIMFTMMTTVAICELSWTPVGDSGAASLVVLSTTITKKQQIPKSPFWRMGNFRNSFVYLDWFAFPGRGVFHNCKFKGIENIKVTSWNIKAVSPSVHPYNKIICTVPFLEMTRIIN